MQILRILAKNCEGSKKSVSTTTIRLQFGCAIQATKQISKSGRKLKSLKITNKRIAKYSQRYFARDINL